MQNTVKLLSTAILGLTLSTAVPLVTPATTIAANQATSVYSRAIPGVVTVVGSNGHGSGFIVSSNGLVITNAHVVQGQPAVVTLIMPDGTTKIPADVVGFANDGVDLAVLKINRNQRFHVLSLANSRVPAVGSSVYAIGTPLALENQNTLTTGIVSALRDDGAVIQHNAAIQQGNSGGPLLNDRGEVIGVNYFGKFSRVVDSQGRIIGGTAGSLNYALSVNLVRRVLADADRGTLSPVSTLPR